MTADDPDPALASRAAGLKGELQRNYRSKFSREVCYALGNGIPEEATWTRQRF